MEVVLLQYASGACEPLLDVSRKWHQVYCERHGYGYLTCRHVYDNERNPVWNKLAFLLEFLRDWPHVENVVLLDADALIVNADAQLTEALPSTKQLALLFKHFCNSGTMVMRNCPEVLDLFEKVWERPLVTPNDLIDAQLFHVLCQGMVKVKFADIGSKWNFFEYYHGGKRETDCKRDDANILAWHGQDRNAAAAEMRQIVDSLLTKGVAA